ncbi:efflux transporter, RND family, MFP subunit, putative [Coleofasciculus chthonoplastes PCC 7420]|uniref:Efflux transporter, RND family, MFP subunit, putative n=1 Tax=Coleofasciculus chthonoplastes PCC 7420 TaxID=118168 RepID=B4VRK7_9CYAN|nr:efflux RND transporter periplasmic adaptor subunit [Coleofasciculus chthonoplastes]EDX75596.1 efflux transporter, RND family, MFP subunit, putative [Coleofasciculus chthonoplastes PCC 7420]
MSLEPPLPHSDLDESRPNAPDPLSENSDHLTSKPDQELRQPSSRKKYGRVLLGLGVFAVLSSSILLITNQIKPTNSMAGMEGHDMSGMSHDDMMQVNGAFNPIPVTVEVVQLGEFEASVSYTGSIMPYQEVVVYPRVAGQLTNYSVYPGDRVKAGQVLAQLDATERSTELAEAQAEADAMETSLRASQVQIEEQTQEIARLQAELDYLQLRQNRFATLVAEGAIAQDDLDIVASEVKAKQAAIRKAQAARARLLAEVDQNRAKVGQARAEVGTATVMQSYTKLQSPISGIIQTRMVDPGVVVQPGMGVLKIGDYSRVRLQANVAQEDAGSIRVGTPIQAQVPGVTDQPLTGEITSIFPQTNNNTRTVTVEAVVDNPQERLLSGQFLDMTILTNRKASTISVPRNAVGEFNGADSVWVIEDNQAQRRQVERGMISGDRMEITQGLKVGDRVITSGDSRLVPNVQVTVVDDTGDPVPMLGESSQDKIEVAIVDPDPTKGFKSGGAELILEVRDPQTQEPLPAKDVAVDVTMPMPNMPPMTTMVELEPTDKPGQFQVKTHFGMAGEWHIKVEVKDPDYAGQTMLKVAVE